MPTPVLDTRAGRYYAFWSEGRRSQRKSMGTSDRAVAEQRFAQWLLLGGHKGGAAGEAAPRLTIGELWSVYDKQHIQKNTEAKDTARYSWKNLEPHFGHLSPEQIDEGVVDDYEEARVEGVIGRPSVSATVRREIAAMIACLNWHASPERGKKRLLDPKEIPHIRLPTASDPRDRWLTQDEIKRLFAAAERGTDRLRMFLWLALETAARKQAILDLTWDRVDFETGMIHYAVPGRRQTKKRRPSVPMSSTLRRVLEPRRATSGPVVPQGGDLWAQIQSAVVRASLAERQPRGTGEAIKSTGISPHTFRHTAATHMARRGVPLYDIAGILGNTLAMVERVYSHHCPGRLRDAVNSISGFMEAAE